MNPHIEEAVANLNAARGRYAKTERYYDGDHDLVFATQKFQNTFGSLFREFALNLCPAVCDAVRDKLKITGFSVDEAAGAGVDAVKRETRRIWHANAMATRAGEVHKEALKNGDAYVIVWPNAEGDVTIYPNRARSCTAVYDPEFPGRVIRAAKYWRGGDKRMRLNLFYADRVEKYVCERPNESMTADAAAFVPFDDGTGAVVENPVGAVPVFHFANNADIGSPGRSEIDGAIPIQDGLNKSVLDMLVAMEYSAFRQRWAVGIDMERDSTTGQSKELFETGPGKIWVSTSKEAKFGDFPAADLEQFLKVKDGFRIDMASVTGTPLHYFLQNTRGFASGESLRKTETRFLAKVRDRQEAFGQVWADVMQTALKMSGIGAGARLLTQWEDAAPISDRERLENIVLKQQIGISVKQALAEAGYGVEE